MRKYFSSLLLILVVLQGCAALKPPVRKVIDNTFYSSSPKMEVTVSPNFRYMGKEYSWVGTEEHHRGVNIDFYSRGFGFLDSDRTFLINIMEAPGNAYWLHPSSSFANIKNKLDDGKTTLGHHEYQYCTFKSGNYIVKIFARNVYADTVQVQLRYAEPVINDAASKQEELEAFNKNCEAAFTVK